MLKLCLSVFAASVLALGSTVAAQAQSRAFVAAQGADSNPCTFAQPCRTFQHAHDVVAANAEIDVLDPAGYGQLTISKAVSIQGHGFAGISVSAGQTGITVNAGANDEVSVRGVLIDGAAVGSSGIKLNSGMSLVVEDCVVRNHASHGILIQPSAASKIAVSRTLVTANGADGIHVQPTGSSVNVYSSFSGVEVHNNAQKGIALVGSSMFDSNLGAVAVDSVASNNGAEGFYALSATNAFTGTLLHLFHVATIGNSIGAHSDSASIIFTGQSYFADGWSSAGNGCINTWGDNYNGSAACNVMTKH